MNTPLGQADFDPNAAYRPESPDDFASAFANALCQNYGFGMVPTPEGGYSIQTGSAGMVLTPRSEGVISVVSFVVTGMTNPSAAGPVVRRLNDESLFVRFQILDDAVVASCDAPGLPFVPQHLYTLIRTVGETLDAAGPELVAVAGGLTLSDALNTSEQPPSPKNFTLPEPFTADVRAALKQYVYMLVDPRDDSPFYIGKGTGNRIYQHVWGALAGLRDAGDGHELLSEGEPSDDTSVTNAKEHRIREIAAEGLMVSHHIVRVCKSPEEAFAVEQALISAFRTAALPSEYGGLTNIVSGHYDFAIENTRAEEIARRLGAAPAPTLPRPSLVLKVNAAGDTDDADKIYEASRSAWSVGKDMRDIPDLPVFVVAHDVVRAVYRAQRWSSIQRAEGKKGLVWVFDGILDPDLNPEYVGRRLTPADFGLLNWGQQGCHPLRSSSVSTRAGQDEGAE